MNLNSQSSFFPPQPDNPTEADRDLLEQYALDQLGRPEDLKYIKKLMSPPRDITSIVPQGLKGTKIGIIGAGLAGLSSAFELRKTGADITIFEANDSRIGGRVYTYYFNENIPLYGELGAMRIPVSHETVWHYINLFKLYTRPFIQNNPNAFIYLRNTRVRNDNEGKNVAQYIYPKYCLSDWERKISWQKLYFYGLENPLLYSDPEYRKELLQVKPFYHSSTLCWDYLNIRQVMEAFALSPGAIALISSLSTLPGQNLYNSYVDLAQANYSANLWYLYEISGGTSGLVKAFVNSLNNEHPSEYDPDIAAKSLGKITWKQGNWITGIHYKMPGKKIILSHRSYRSDRDLYDMFDYVICAIPFSTLRTVDIDPLFSSIKMQAIKEVNYINSTKSLLLCSRRFWEEGGTEKQILGGASYTDLPIISMWYPSHHPGTKSASIKSGVLLACYNDGLDAVRLGNLNPKERLAEIKREVEEVHGLQRGYLNRIVQDSKTITWNDQPWQRGALCFFSPEQKKLFSYAMASPEYDNRLFMAGDHISAIHRWMQGALQSGMQAANDLAAAWKIHSKK